MLAIDQQALSADLKLRQRNVQKALVENGYDAVLIAGNVNLIYLFGTLFMGAAYIPACGEAQFFVRRPVFPAEQGLHPIRKIEQIPDILQSLGYDMPRRVLLELDELPYSDILRQQALFPNAEFGSASSFMRQVRMIKTDYEIDLIRRTAWRHKEFYEQIPELYKPGMTDHEFQLELEYRMRQMGSIGIFRTYGPSMEVHMGTILAGKNADAASPYDFSLGGAGQPALPLGANGTRLEEGMCLMIDMAGNYSPYVTDISRCFRIGEVSDLAKRLHQLSVDMHERLMKKAPVGKSCAAIYIESMEMVEEAKAEAYFMGMTQQARFVGHGIGLQVNEMPVMMERSKDLLMPGMVVAFEPKFIVPDMGAVGIENTYLVTEQGLENLSPCPEEMINLLH